jgi:hypothetical protein
VVTDGGFRNRPKTKYGYYGAKAINHPFVLPVSDSQQNKAVKMVNKRIKRGK